MNVGHPFRRSRSKFLHLDGVNQERDKNEDESFESEVNVFQKLHLDRNDDSAAIEILLEESKSTNIPSRTKMLSPLTPKSLSRDSSEGRKSGSFLHRLFKGSPRRSTAKPPAIDPIPEGRSLDVVTDGWGVAPRPPCIEQQAKSFHDLSDTVKMSNPRVPVQSDDFDTFSSMSDLSGSKATTVYTRRRSLGKPLTLERHESLGVNSIQDVRNTLKVMELQLDKATHSGERVSRQKVMNALFTVADSLEDLEEREMLRKELQGYVKTDHQTRTQNRSFNPPQVPEVHKAWDNEEKENVHNRAPTTTQFQPKAPEGQDVASPFKLFSSVGKMFSVSDDEKKAADKALNDLFWTEFVANRKDGEENGQKARNKIKPVVPRKTVLEVKQAPSQKESPGKDRGGNHSSTPAAVVANAFQPFARSWWGAGTTSEASAGSHDGGSSSSSSSWDEDEDLNVDDGQFDEYDDDEDTTDSEDNLNYLPNSITVQKPGASRNEPSHLLRRSYAFSRNRSFNAAAKPANTNTRYRVRMVETESRMGFEMGSP